MEKITCVIAKVQIWRRSESLRMSEKKNNVDLKVFRKNKFDTNGDNTTVFVTRNLGTGVTGL